MKQCKFCHNTNRFDTSDTCAACDRALVLVGNNEYTLARMLEHVRRQTDIGLLKRGSV